MKIEFPAQESFEDGSGQAVRFPVICDGAKRACRISFEAIGDHFGMVNNTPAAALVAFKAHRSTIEQRVRNILAKGHVGDVLLQSHDF